MVSRHRLSTRGWDLEGRGAGPRVGRWVRLRWEESVPGYEKWPDRLGDGPTADRIWVLWRGVGRTGRSTALGTWSLLPVSPWEKRLYPGCLKALIPNPVA